MSAFFSIGAEVHFETRKGWVVEIGEWKSPLENTMKIEHSTEKSQKRLPLKITDLSSFFYK